MQEPPRAAEMKHEGKATAKAPLSNADLPARLLVCFCRQVAEVVHPAVHIRIVQVVVVIHRLQHLQETNAKHQSSAKANFTAALYANSVCKFCKRVTTPRTDVFLPGLASAMWRHCQGMPAACH